MLKRRSACVMTVLLMTMLIMSSCTSYVEPQKMLSAPQRPENLQVWVTDQGIGLSWDAVPDATGYTVFWGSQRGEYRSIMDCRAAPIIISGLRPGALYYVTVTARNQIGEGPYSQEAAVVFDNDTTKAGDYLALGTDSMERGRFSNGYAYISTAIRLDPANPYAYRQRAMLLEKVGLHDLAKQDHAAAQGLLKNRPLSKRVEHSAEIPVTR
ncbi:MAG: fibronectin type III domain-containing protein [Pseudomonadota bacterium]